MALVSRSRSINPKPPRCTLFLPAALLRVGDFSPEWWDLVHTSTWFREFRFLQHPELESFEEFGAVDNIANLCVTIDNGICDEVSLEMEEVPSPIDVKRGITASWIKFFPFLSM